MVIYISEHISLLTSFFIREPYEDRGLNNWCEQLWEADINRLVPDKDYDLDLQGRTRFSYDGPDKAEDPLFSFVTKEALAKPTYKGRFLQLT